MPDMIIEPVQGGPVDFDAAMPRKPMMDTPFQTQTETDKVKELISRAQAAKREYEEKWREYREFYNGQQWRKDRPKYRVSQVINVCFATIETVHPLLTDDMVKMSAQPREPGQYEAAEKLTNAFDFHHEKLNLGRKVSIILKDALMYGSGVCKVFWDSDALPMIQVPDEYGGMTSEPMGEIGVTRINPFYIYPDPTATTVEDCAFLIEGKPVSLDLVKLNYPEKADDLKAEDLPIESRTGQYGKPTGETTDTTRDEGSKYPYGASPKDDDRVMVYEVWMRNVGMLLDKDATVEEIAQADQEFPNGRLITICGDIVLSDRQWPFEDGLYPYVKFDDYMQTDKFWGMGEIEQIMPQQKEINKRASQIIENAQLTANPPLVVDKNSGVDTDLLTSRPGIIIEKNPGAEVGYLEPPRLPEYVFTAQKESKLDLDMVSGVHDVSRGALSQSITSGVAIAELQEAAHTRIREKVRNRNESIVDVAQLMISRMQQYYEMPRQMRILGGKPEDTQGQAEGMPPPEPFVFQTLERQELGGMFDVRIETGTELPQSQAGKFQEVIALFELGIADEEAVLDVINFPNRAKLMERKRAKEAEQMQMQQQQMMQQQQQQQGMEQDKLALQEQQMMLQDEQAQDKLGLQEQQMMQQQMQAEMQAQQQGMQGGPPGGPPPLEGMPAPPQGMPPEEAERIMAMMQGAQGGGEIPPELAEMLGGEM